MNASSELRGWLTTVKELWREERQKHPYRVWFILVVAFLYAFLKIYNG